MFSVFISQAKKGNLGLFFEIKTMSFNKISAALFVLAISFIGFGDRVLPESVGQHSETIRGHLLGMLPSIRPQNNNAKTEEAIERLGQ